MVTPTFLEFVHLVVRGDVEAVSRALKACPELAKAASGDGANEREPAELFVREIPHQLYRGDTALHVAAASFQQPVAEVLVARGADCRAKNRRGAEPLHYAADANRRRPLEQVAIIEFLLSAGADPDALTKDGVSPLHRAVRTRSSAAVKALVNGGANPRLPNRTGSTPLHLAVQTTGAQGSGSDEARREQHEIIRLLLEFGASAGDKDGRGRSVFQAATSDWIRGMLTVTVKS